MSSTTTRLITAGIAIALLVLAAEYVISNDARPDYANDPAEVAPAPGPTTAGEIEETGITPAPTGPVMNLGSIEPGLDDANDPLAFPNARFAVNGIPLRGGKKGVINLVGPPEGSVLQRAYLYWQWACLEEPIVRRHDTVRVKRIFPEPRAVGGFIQGTLVATGPNPAWCGPEYRSYTYRADVTSIMSDTGGGTYAVTLASGGDSGSLLHANPWAEDDCIGSRPPYADGAALVAIYRSSCEDNGTVYLYDTDLAGATFDSASGLEYTLTHQEAQGLEARLAIVGGDGQTGLGYQTVEGPTQVRTRLNGTIIAGPGSLVNDSDWNGSIARPLPQLFDVHGHDVSDLVDPGATSTTVSFGAEDGLAFSDSLTPVATILFVR